jgi:hypothetical protein
MGSLDGKAAAMAASARANELSVETRMWALTPSLSSPAV